MVTTTSPPKLTATEWNLFEMARSNRIDGLRQAIESKKVNTNVRDRFDRTPLHFAASEGNLAAVRLLVVGHAVVDSYDKFGITPLLWAVYNNHKSVVQFLVEKGAKHTRITKQGHTIVHFVAEANAIGILKYLYHKYRSLKVDEPDKTGLTPFLVAAGRGNQTLMEVFVRQKCNILATDKRNRNVLHIAAFNGQVSVLRYLLRMPRVLELKDNLDYDQKSPLHYAAFANHQEIVRTLLDAGCDPDIDSEKHECPLIAVSRKGFHTCIDSLLTYGADKEKRTKIGNSALHVACLANLPDTVQFLVWRRFDLLARNKRGQTPLHISVEQNKIETVELLILIGAPLNVKDDDSCTPLEVAAKASHTALVDLIIKAERWHQQCPVECEEIRYQLMNTTAQQTEASGRASGHNSGLAQERSFLGLNGKNSYYTPREATFYDPSAGHTSADYVLSGMRSPHSGPGLQPISENTEIVDNYRTVYINGSRTTGSPTYSGSPRHPRRPDDDTSDSLSLGHEASRGWTLGGGGGGGDTLEHPSRYNGEVRSILFSDKDEQRSVFSSPKGRRRKKRATTQHLMPNGELVIRLGETYVPSTDGTSAVSGEVQRSGTVVDKKNFSLLQYKHPYANEMKVMLYNLSHNDLKPGDWQRLAHLWGFSKEHIEAIEAQDTGKSSYKDQGYRMFDIWIHGVNKDDSPMNDLYRGLIGIHRSKLANTVRKRLESGGNHKTCSIQ